MNKRGVIQPEILSYAWTNSYSVQVNDAETLKPPWECACLKMKAIYSHVIYGNTALSNTLVKFLGHPDHNQFQFQFYQILITKNIYVLPFVSIKLVGYMKRLIWNIKSTIVSFRVKVNESFLEILCHRFSCAILTGINFIELWSKLNKILYRKSIMVLSTSI